MARHWWSSRHKQNWTRMYAGTTLQTSVQHSGCITCHTSNFRDVIIAYYLSKEAVSLDHLCCINCKMLQTFYLWSKPSFTLYNYKRIQWNFVLSSKLTLWSRALFMMAVWPNLPADSKNGKQAPPTPAVLLKVKHTKPGQSFPCFRWTCMKKLSERHLPGLKSEFSFS